MATEKKNGAVVVSPELTRAEARRFVGEYTGTMRERVFLCVLRAGDDGATDEEIRKALRMRINSVTPRRGELATAGLIDCHPTATRDNDSGCRAVVWVSTGAKYDRDRVKSTPAKTQADRAVLMAAHAHRKENTLLTRAALLQSVQQLGGPGGG